LHLIDVESHYKDPFNLVPDSSPYEPGAQAEAAFGSQEMFEPWRRMVNEAVADLAAAQDIEGVDFGWYLPRALTLNSAFEIFGLPLYRLWIS
jgi:hypothetical protein